MNSVKFAYEKGYRVAKDGTVLGLRGDPIHPHIRDGYRRISVRVSDSKSYNAPVHRLVAYQKYGDSTFQEGIEVRHLDGNSLNNAWDNIALGTHSENMMDQPASQRLRKSLVATALVRKFDHKEIMSDRESGMSYKQIMQKHGIKSKGTISFIVNSSLASQEADWCRT